jgi:uncharacterized protein YbjT (DUF2867 family)
MTGSLLARAHAVKPRQLTGAAQQKSHRRMRVLILGGYGLIGLEAARRLARDHEVFALGRSSAHGARIFPHVRWFRADMATLDTPKKWAPFLDGVDAVVNASGALQDGARDNLTAVQDISIRALIRASAASGVKHFVQISAPGANANAATAFLRTKAAADDALKASGLQWVILRPGLVWGRTATGGTALVRTLAAIPLIQPLVLADSRVQMVDIDDVSEALAAALSGAIPACTDAALVEERVRSLREIVSSVRAWHGFSPARWSLDTPAFLGTAAAVFADCAGWLSWRSPLRSTALRALEHGVTGDGAAWRAAGGAQPISFEESLSRRPATRQDRVFARAQLAAPLVILCLSAFWLVSGLIGLARIDSAAETIAGAVGSPRLYVVGGAVADIALGLAILWRPWARAACFGMVLLTGAYLLAGTILTPQLWMDPLGPFVKALPAAVLALVCVALLEER